jgi:hypothetical protein
MKPNHRSGVLSALASRRRGKRRRQQRSTYRLWLEPLEDRTLLSVSISGTIFNDLHGSGIRTPDDPTVPAAVVFLDANQNGKLDQQTALHFDGPAGANSIVSDATGTHSLPLTITGLGPVIANFKINLNLTTTSGFVGPVSVDLVSPADNAQPTYLPPSLLTLGSATSGGTFNDSLTDLALTAVPTVLGTSTPPGGPFRPASAFSNTTSFVYNDYLTTGNPNGPWELFFFKGTTLNPAAANTLQLNSWSLDFTGSEISTTTDVSGNYSFSNLVPGTYHVTVAATAQGTNPSRTVVLPAGNQPRTGIDIGITPLPDLAATSFQTSSSAGADWGSDVFVHYTIVNRGPADAAKSEAEILLSSDSAIDIGDASSASPVVVQVPALAAGASFSGTATFHLPGAPGHPPAGFSTVDQAFLGMIVNSSNAVAESNTSNNANQGEGIDLAPAISFGNQAVTTGNKPQIEPSLAVDPLNSQHLVMAYTDYTLGFGYGGIAVEESTNGGTSWQRSTVPLPSYVSANHPSGAGHATVTFQVFNQGGSLTSRPFISFMAVAYRGPFAPGLLYPSAGAGPDGHLQRSYGMLADNGIFVSRSDDGGLTWNAAVAVVAPNLWDGGSNSAVMFDALPALAIDASEGSPHIGNMYVTWTRAYPVGSYPGGLASTAGTDIMLAVSTDGGQTWSPKFRSGNIPVLRGMGANDVDASTAAGGGAYNFSQVTVAANGTVVFSYQEGAEFRWAASANGGAGIALYSNGSSISNEPFFNDSETNNAPDYGSTAPQPFRSFPVRNIVADPSRLGMLYSVEAIQTKSSDATPVQLDQANIYFARATSTGSTTTWQRIFAVGGSYGNINTYPLSDLQRYYTAVNDDDGSNYLRKTTASAAGQEEIAVQAAPRLFVDSKGNILIAWYDTRRDVNSKKLDVYATVSLDGGQTFSPNFRLTDTSIDPSTGQFTDPLGQTNDTLGDFLGVTAANGVGYVAWTDTRGGNRQIYFTRFALASPPPAPLNRFEPDATPATAADLGTIAGQKSFPRLFASGGVVDFYKVTPGASGSFLVTLSAAKPLLLQVYDITGVNLLATGSALYDANGNLVGQQLLLQGAAANQPLLVKVSGLAPGAPAMPYALKFLALTGDLGTNVTGSATNTLVANGVALYDLTAPVAGTIEVQLSAQPGVTGQLNLTILNSTGTAVLATAGGAAAGTTIKAIATLTAGQVVLIKVSGATVTSQGNFALQFNVRDQFQSTNPSSLYFPVPGSLPVSLAVGDLNGDSFPDIAAVNTDLTNPISVLLNDRAGLFNAPQTYNAGTGSSTLPGGGTRTLLLNDFNNDRSLDVAVTNFASADVSVLLNRGGGTLGSDHRSDALSFPGRILAADLNGDKKQDLVVFPVTTVVGVAPQVVVLLGHGDGTFAPPVLLQTNLAPGTTLGVVGDFTGNGKMDIAVFSANDPTFDVFLGNGDGTFAAPLTELGPTAVSAVVAADFNGDNKTDLAIGGGGAGAIFILLSKGDGTFTQAQVLNANTDPAQLSSTVIGLAVADMGGVDSSGNSTLGLPDGRLDLLAVTKSFFGSGAPQLNVLCQRAAAPGLFTGFAKATQIATGNFNGALDTGDFNRDGRTDVAIADGNNIRVIYNNGINITPNTTLANARNLGDAVHLETLKQVIAPGFTDAFFSYIVPTETVPTAGPQVVDISALFENQFGPGLQMQISDGRGNVFTGSRIRIMEPQGTVLTVHISGAAAGGAGAYTLVIDILPQVVSITPQWVLPGVNGQPAGPVTSLVITLQGDRLDRTLAENPANYGVISLGDGSPGRQIPVASVVYDPGANTQVSVGRTYPDTVRQTITLVFANALPVGVYEIDLSPALQTAAFNSNESNLLVGGAAFAGHPVVAVMGNGQITNGAKLVVPNLVPPSGQVGGFDVFNKGTSYLTNFHDDMGSVLNSNLTQNGDAAPEATTKALLDQIVGRFGPAAAASGTSFLVIVLDPVSIQMADPNHNRTTYDLTSTKVSNNIGRTFFQVGGNVEVLVLASLAGTYTLNIYDVQASARGAAVLFNNGTAQIASLTDAIRLGQRDFQFTVPEAAVAAAQLAHLGSTVTANAGQAGTVITPAGAGSVTQALVLTILTGVLQSAGASETLIGTLTTGTVVSGTANSGGEGVDDSGRPTRAEQRRRLHQVGLANDRQAEVAEAVVPLEQLPIAAVTGYAINALETSRQRRRSQHGPAAVVPNDPKEPAALSVWPDESKEWSNWADAVESMTKVEEAGTLDSLLAAAFFASGMCLHVWFDDVPEQATTIRTKQVVAKEPTHGQ